MHKYTLKVFFNDGASIGGHSSIERAIEAFYTIFFMYQKENPPIRIELWDNYNLTYPVQVYDVLGVIENKYATANMDRENVRRA